MRFAEIVRRISYKPGWRIEIEERTETLYVTYRAPDVNDPTGETLIAFHVTYFPDLMRTEADVIDFVRGAIHQTEHHEMEEWFHLDGKHVDDPHRFDGVA